MDCNLSKARRPKGHISHLSVSVVNDSTIRVLNRDYRGKDKPTDVLSFSLVEGEVGAFPSISLGDVVISVETAQRQAKELQLSLQSEILRLLVHGILHLSGFDHEKVPLRKVKEMQKMEDVLFLAQERYAQRIRSA